MWKLPGVIVYILLSWKYLASTHTSVIAVYGHMMSVLLIYCMINMKSLSFTFAASQWQLGQDSFWVQDTENSKTSHCGRGPCGHWWFKPGVWHWHWASLLLVINQRRVGCREENPETLELTADSISLVHTVQWTTLTLLQDIYCPFLII